MQLIVEGKYNKDCTVTVLVQQYYTAALKEIASTNQQRQRRLFIPYLRDSSAHFAVHFASPRSKSRTMQRM
jgi:DNA primase